MNSTIALSPEEELEALEPFTDHEFDQLENELRLRAAVLGWTGDPLEQPTTTVLAAARAVRNHRP